MYALTAIKTEARAMLAAYAGLTVRDAIELAVDKLHDDTGAAKADESRLEAKHSRSVDRWYA